MKTKRKWLQWSIALLLFGYIILTVIPNMFIKKGMTPDQMQKLQVIAHRGGAGIGMENTLSCIEKGVVAGADMIEVDIHLTQDGQLLVCHDETIDRTTNGKGRISEMTLEELLRFHIVDADGNITDEHLPTLAEVFTLVDGRAKLLIEIKRTGKLYQGIEEKLIEEIAQFHASSWVVVQSFNDSVLEQLHQLDPGLRLEKLLFFKFPGLPFIFDGRFTGFSFKKYHYITSFNIFYPAARSGFIRAIHHAGKEVKIWTLNDPGEIPHLTLEGVITDRPDLF